MTFSCRSRFIESISRLSRSCLSASKPLLSNIFMATFCFVKQCVANLTTAELPLPIVVPNKYWPIFICLLLLVTLLLLPFVFIVQFEEKFEEILFIFTFIINRSKKNSKNKFWKKRESCSEKGSNVNWISCSKWTINSKRN